MRRFKSVLLAVAALAIAATAFAVPPPRGTADLSPLGASPVTGNARLSEIQSEVAVHLQIRGLEPGTVYTAQRYLNQTCSLDASTTVIAEFTSNPAGIANINVKIPNMTLSDFGSISVVLGTEVQACGAVLVQ